MDNIDIGSFVINRYNILDITQLLNGRNEVNFNGCIGIVESICDKVSSGDVICIVNYNGEKVKGYQKDLILVKGEEE